MTRASAPALGGPARRQSTTAYGPLLLISFAMLIGFSMMQSLGIMAEAAKAELRLSDSAIAAVQGIAAALPLALRECHEKLTLELIARRCSLNRSKLARGFRQLYSCSVIEALAERRLVEARKQLIATDLPVGIIGYRSGYLNNASFTRAFGHRFGVSPSDYRACGLAA